MTAAHTRPQSKVFLHALIVCAGVFICAWGGITLTREAGRLSSIWPATAFGLAFLLRCPKREWPLLIVSILAGNLLAHMAYGDNLSRTIAISPLNVSEVWFCAYILRRFTNDSFNLRQHDHLLIFAGVAASVPVASAILAASYFEMFQGQNFMEIGLSWYLADALGLIVFTPLFFIIGWDELKSFTAPDVRKKCVSLMAVLGATLSLVFFQNQYPILFLIFPVLALSAFWLGTCGAIVALAVTTVVSIFCTIHGTGPINLIHGSLAEKTFVLQGFLATAALISLPIASALSYRTNLENSLKEAKQAADKANLAKSRFLTSMSHELRTPLNAILGFSQLLGMDQSLSEKTKEHVGFVVSGGDHLLKLVEDVLDLAKIEDGIITIKPETLSCEYMLDEVTELIRPLAKKRDIRIDTFYEPDIFVTADRSRLMQVLVNLLSNAIKYNRPGGTVSVIAKRIEDRIRIKIVDTGFGIAADLQAKVFEPFNRLGAENSDIEGTGIGLAISKQLAEAMNGIIGFSSVEAEGSTFYIELPTAEPVQAAGILLEPAISAAKEKTAMRILYIEDNRANAELMRNIVQNLLKADIMIVSDGRSGLRQARDYAPDLIISDIHLSDMTGHDILKSLRDHPLTSNIPVIALTADATFLQTQKAGDFNRVMSKPFQVKELVQNLEEFLLAA